MTKENYPFDLIASQRYYYLVAFQIERGRFSLQDFWSGCGAIKKEKPNGEFNQLDYVIQHSRIKSKIKFFGTEEDFSIKGDGKPPYKYDVFAIESKKDKLMVFGFPFRNLAKVIIDHLINDQNILSKGSFQKAKLKRLLNQINSNSFSSKYISPSFSNLDLIYTAETDISAIQLDGDNPLKSTLFKDVFESKIESGECILDKCSLKCRVIDHDDIVPLTFSNVHIDSFGNYKLYLHANGKNIFTIPLLFDLMFKSKCLDEQLSNPLNKLKDEQVQ